MLQFESKPPFDFDKFLKICGDLIPDRDFSSLKRVSMNGEYIDDAYRNATLRKWKEFDVAVRNEFVPIRARHRKEDPLKYLHEDGFVDPSISHIAINASRAHTPLEAERLIDRERWRFLDELAIGHYFDFDFLVTYAYKLLILLRWDNIMRADKEALVREMLELS